MKGSRQRPVLQRGNLPFEVIHQIRVYFPICDYNPYAAYLLKYCYDLRAISVHEYREKEREKEAWLLSLSEEEREQERERIYDIELEKYEDRLLNTYNGESYLSDEDDAREGAGGVFDLHVREAMQIMDYFSPSFSPGEKAIEAHLLDAYTLLRKKGFLERVWMCEKLEEEAIEGALQACYPELYKEEKHEKEAMKKKESKKVQFHVNMARGVGLPATLTLPEWIETLNDFDWKCAYCRRAPYTILEHIQPVNTMGGGTTMDNCVPACASCNVTKKDTLPEFLAPEFDGALERIQHYFRERKQRAKQ